MKKLLIFMMTMMPALAVSCGDVNTDDGGKVSLSISVDKDLIQSNGTDAVAITVKLGGEPVTEGLQFYLWNDGSLSYADEYVNDMTFTTTEAGTYNLMVRHGTYNSSTVAITAIPVPVPVTPADSSPESLDFKQRLLLVQFTGTACGFCPGMMRVLHPVLENETGIADNIVWVASHSYSYSSEYPDKAWIDSDFANTFGAEYPSLVFNLSTKYSNSTSHTPVTMSASITSAYNAMSTAAGIAVNMSILGNQVILKATVKAAEAVDYRVGAFLLEDGIKATQISAGSDTELNTHDACIRWIDAGSSYVGHKLDIDKVGGTASKVFVWDLAQIVEDSYLADRYWDPIVKDNLRAAVFVTAKTSDGYSVVNAVATESNAQIIPFEYNQN